jgi:hypothetical protein
MELDEIVRRLKSARSLLNELQQTELDGAEAVDVCAMAAKLEFEVSLLEAELSSQGAAQ